MHKSETIIEAVQQWFTSLPPDVAIMRTYPSDNTRSSIRIDIQPLKNKDAADIGMVIHKPSGYVSLWAGNGFSVDTAYWPDLPIVDICQAIVLGGLQEELRYWRGKVTGSKWTLQMGGVKEKGNDVDMMEDILRLTVGQIIGEKETRTIHYPAYFEVSEIN
jgi:hypothetical protein